MKIKTDLKKDAVFDTYFLSWGCVVLDYAIQHVPNQNCLPLKGNPYYRDFLDRIFQLWSVDKCL